MQRVVCGCRLNVQAVVELCEEVKARRKAQADDAKHPKGKKSIVVLAAARNILCTLAYILT